MLGTAPPRYGTGGVCGTMAGAQSIRMDESEVWEITIPEAADPAPTTVLSSRREIRLGFLAVDDEPQVPWLLRNILSEHGYKLLGTGNPEEW